MTADRTHYIGDGCASHPAPAPSADPIPHPEDCRSCHRDWAALHDYRPPQQHCDWCGRFIAFDGQAWRDQHGADYCPAAGSSDHEPAAS